MKTVALVSRLNLVIYLAAFLIPFTFTQPQLITGTIVNALIFISCEKLNRKMVWPILVLPSLGAVSRGLLFGPQTFFLLYFLPFIWLANYLQSTLFSLIREQKYGVRVVMSALTKYLVLFGVANIYLRLQVVPRIFTTSMGMIQLMTAIMGGGLAYIWLKSKN